MFKKNAFKIFLQLFIFSFLCLTAESNLQLSLRDQVCSSEECYSILKKLGEGVFGKVFLVKDSKEKLFALKWYKTFHNQESSDYSSLTPYYESISSNSLYAESEREFLNGQRFNHPNIIKSVGKFEVDRSNHFLVLEFVRGTTVHNMSRKSISKSEAVQLALQLIDAISYAESLDYYFLDLHAGNVMVNRSKAIKLIDLASFFSFEELSSYPIAYFDSSSSTYTYTLEKKVALTKVPHIEKLEKFFLENPRLQAFNKKVSKMASKEQETTPEDYNHEFRLALSAIYFDILANACVDLVKKTDLGTITQRKLQKQIEQISCNFKKEVKAEGTRVCLQDAMQELTTFFKNLK